MKVGLRGWVWELVEVCTRQEESNIRIHVPQESVLVLCLRTGQGLSEAFLEPQTWCRYPWGDDCQVVMRTEKKEMVVYFASVAIKTAIALLPHPPTPKRHPSPPAFPAISQRAHTHFMSSCFSRHWKKSVSIARGLAVWNSEKEDETKEKQTNKQETGGDFSPVWSV